VYSIVYTPKEVIMTSYWDLIQETKVQVELNKDEELAEINTEEDKVAKEASDFIESQLFFMHMDEAEPEQPIYELKKEEPMPEGDDPTVCNIKRVKRAHLHGTASIVLDLSDLDGMTEEFLFNQPSHGEWLEEVTKEVS